MGVSQLAQALADQCEGGIPADFAPFIADSLYGVA